MEFGKLLGAEFPTPPPIDILDFSVILTKMIDIVFKKKGVEPLILTSYILH